MRLRPRSPAGVWRCVCLGTVALDVRVRLNRARCPTCRVCSSPVAFECQVCNHVGSRARILFALGVDACRRRPSESMRRRRRRPASVQRWRTPAALHAAPLFPPPPPCLHKCPRTCLAFGLRGHVLGCHRKRRSSASELPKQRRPASVQRYVRGGVGCFLPPIFSSTNAPSTPYLFLCMSLVVFEWVHPLAHDPPIAMMGCTRRRCAARRGVPLHRHTWYTAAFCPPRHAHAPASCCSYFAALFAVLPRAIPDLPLFRPR